jgi:DNA-binding NtrC family response regulator
MQIAPDGDLISDCHLRLALLEAVESHWARAERAARRSIDHAVTYDMIWEEAQGSKLLAIILPRLGRQSEADKLSARAMELFRRMGVDRNRDLIATWLSVLGMDSEGTPRQDKRERDDSQIATRRSATRRRAGVVRRASIDPIWEEVGFVTNSPLMAESLRRAGLLARDGAHILVVGETGTGKEHITGGVHRLSGRKGRLIPFNCASCAEDLVEGELSGVERGAYTGADRKRSGLLVEADGGTLLLDEVGDLPPRAQGALMRFLDSGEVRPVGSTTIRTVQVGVIAAAQPTFYHRIETGHFRNDLFYRLAEGRVDLPPLRRRPEDLPLLMTHIWKRLYGDERFPASLLGKDVLTVLERHTWPGNVRELIHLLRAFRLRWSTGEGQADSVAREVRSLLQSLKPQSAQRQATRPTKDEIERTLEMTGGNVTRAAALLGISRQTVYRIRKSPSQRKDSDRSQGGESQDRR